MTEEWPERTRVEDVLAYAAEDWVHPSELLNVVRDACGVEDPCTLRDTAVGLLARLVADGLVVIGDVAGSHLPWDCSSGEAVLRVAQEWAQRENPFVMPGELFWLDATPAGEAIGKAVWARESEA
jgi:predicted urease superfamily metal-dependent hydrolase